jgi:atypical dual specificity phosphatase
LTDRGRLPDDADWIVEDRILALSLPTEADVAALSRAGFTAVVTVASEEYADPVRDWCVARGLRHLRYRVPDMAVPEAADVRDFVAEVAHELAREGRVAVHCLGGVGRTGTLIACYLVSTGCSADEALAEVRRRRPGSVQTRGQELCIARYAKELGRPLGRIGWMFAGME